MSAAPRLELDGVVKAFPGARALDGVSLSVAAGEAHALLGENGAGKSTLLSILSGVQRADAGAIRIDGRPAMIRTPSDARAAGVALIHQELQHVPALSVAQNLFLGRPRTRLGGLLVDRRGQEAEARRVLADLDPGIDPGARIGGLKAAQRQIVEIARAVMEDARVIAMDEPTSSLAPAEVARLAALIGRLTARGVAVVYVSHKLGEVFEICARATVLRDGAVVGAVDLADETPETVVSMMVGRTLDPARRRSHATAEPALRVEGLSGGPVRDVSFTLHRGEVLGVSGLVGAGRTELMRLIAGADRPASGRVEIAGSTVAQGRPRAAIRAGLGYLPEERKRDGIVRGRSVASNLALPSMRRFAPRGIVRRRALRDAAVEILSGLDLRPLDVDRAIGTFSGGNQQKAILGRWLAAEARVLLFDEPTRGIDVGAKAEIHVLIERLASEGRAIVVVSSEMPELIRLADRVLVMREGRLAAELAQDEITEAALAAHAVPGGDGREAA